MAETPQATYLLNESPYEAERQRLLQLEAEWGGKTHRHLQELGVSAGWRCLEVGAGAGGVAAWLAERVGASGQVVATDINPRFLDAAQLPPQVEIRRHDITSDPLEEGVYDLVHCRFLLIHLKDPQAVLTRMARALRPGGWLLVEEPVTEPVAVLGMPDAAQFDRLSRQAFEILRETGMNVWLGPQLPQMARTAGLQPVGGEQTTRLIRGGSPDAASYLGATVTLGAPLLRRGLVTPESVAAQQAAFRNPEFQFLSFPVLSVWGQRP